MFLVCFEATITAILEIFILGLIGFMLVKRRFLSYEGLNNLSRLVIFITLPLFIISRFIKNFSFSLYSNWWLFPLLSVCITVLGFLVASLFIWTARAREEKIQFLSLVSFQNSGYLPLALVAALLSNDEATSMFIYIFLFLIGFNLLTILDLWILENGHENKTTGLKFFNVFGPNEYHKGEMRSVICKRFPEVRDKGYIRLFKSYRDDFKDGEQKRDFIYIKDTVEVMYYFFMNPDKTGIFNLGTGMARSWNDLANAMFAALGKEPKIEYIEMPEYLRPRYQYFTQAKIDKLRAAGCDFKFRSLGDSVKDYIQYLQEGSYL